MREVKNALYFPFVFLFQEEKNNMKEYTIEFIREVLDRLDTVSGLSTKQIPVVIKNTQKLGCFVSKIVADKIAVPVEFQFNENILRGKYPEETTIEIIKHEYAHFMSFMLYPKELFSAKRMPAHGKEFKKCCEVIKCSLTSACAKLEATEEWKAKYENEESRKQELIRNNFKYAVKCSRCSFVYYYKRRGKILKNIRKCYCPKCCTGFNENDVYELKAN